MKLLRYSLYLQPLLTRLGTGHSVYSIRSRSHLGTSAGRRTSPSLPPSWLCDAIVASSQSCQEKGIKRRQRSISEKARHRSQVSQRQQIDPARGGPHPNGRGSEAAPGSAAHGRVCLPVTPVRGELRVQPPQWQQLTGGGDPGTALATLRRRRTAHCLQKATVGSPRSLAAHDHKR